MPIHKSINRNFFKKWSNNMSYILGFFAADGYITVNNRGGQFWCIDISDFKLIKKIKNIIESEHKIGKRKRKNGTTYRLQIGSIEMCNDLRKLSFNERKTKRLLLPKIPNKYFSDFVRGYFDGDGNVWSGKINKKRKTQTLIIQTVFTSCSHSFLKEINNKLLGMNVKSGTLSKGKGEYYRLRYGIESTLNLYEFMYNDLGISNLFLKRKKDIFDKYIKMRS